MQRLTLALETPDGPATFSRVNNDFGRRVDFGIGAASAAVHFGDKENDYDAIVNTLALIIKARNHLRRSMNLTELNYTQSPWGAYRRSVENRAIEVIFRKTIPATSSVIASDAVCEGCVTVGLSSPRVTRDALLVTALRLYNMARWSIATQHTIRLISRAPLKRETYDKISIDRDIAAIAPNID